MRGCRECEQKILERMDSVRQSKMDKDLQRHIDECQPCRKFARRMKNLKTKMRVMPKVEASPYFATMLKQRIRRDYRRNQREIIPMILSLERWVPIMGIAGFLVITGIWLVNNRSYKISNLPDKIEMSELQYVLEEPYVMPASQSVPVADSLFQTVQAEEARMMPVSF
jgi:hypothetical protein